MSVTIQFGHDPGSFSPGLGGIWSVEIGGEVLEFAWFQSRFSGHLILAFLGGNRQGTTELQACRVNERALGVT